MAAKCSACKQEMRPGVACKLKKYTDFADGVARKRIPHSGDENCGDCACPPGGLHHPGCDMERCPKCQGQALSCDCCDTEES